MDEKKRIQAVYEKTILENSRVLLLKKIDNLLAKEMKYGVISNNESKEIKADVEKILKA